MGPVAAAGSSGLAEVEADGESGNGDDSSPDDPNGDAPEMNYGNSGSIDASVNDAGQSTDTTELADDEDEIVDEVEEEPIEDVADEGFEAEPGDTQRDSGTQDKMSSDVDPVAGPTEDESVGREAVHSDAAELTVHVESDELSPNRTMVVLEDTAEGGESQASTMSTVDEPGAAPMQTLTGMPTTIIGMAGTFVAAVLSPFLAPRPVAPAESPLLLAVMAWARREWQHVLLNRTPHGVVDTITTSEDAEVTVDVITNADPEEHVGDVVTVTEVTQPQHGMVTVEGGELTYTPDPDFHGTDTFTYTISDEDSPLHIHGWRGLWGALTGGDALHTDTVTVTVTVTPVNDAPGAVDDTFTVDEDSENIVIDVLDNDTDGDGDDLTVTGVGDAENGSVSLENGVITYTPDADFDGTDSFTYTVSDGQGGTATGTVHVTVEGVNDGPVAVDDVVTVDEGSGPTVIDVLANDTDPDGTVLTVVGVQAAENGVVALRNGVLTYVPNAGFTGTDSFTYTVADANNATATATVTVTVAAADDGTITFEDGARPSEVFVTSDPTRIYVLTGSQLRIVDPTTGEWLDTIELGANPFSFTMSPDRRYAYIGTNPGGTAFVPVGRIDLETGTLTQIGGVRQPTAMAMSPDGGTLYVTNNQDGTVSAINTATGAYRVINTGLQSSAIAISEDGTTLYVGSILNDVRVVDIATGNYTVLPTGTYDGMNAARQSITVVGDWAYVTDGLNDKLAVIDTDTNTIIGSYDVGDGPTSVTATADGEMIVVANGGGDNITVITKEHGVLGSISVGNNPTDIDIAADFRSIYVTTSEGISVIPVEDLAALVVEV